VNTFVVRIYGSDQDRASLRGVVDEVASGIRETFHDAEELLAILVRHGEHHDADRITGNG
jgi:hypothetical protein